MSAEKQAEMRPEFREVQRNSLLIRAYVRPEDLPVGKRKMDRFLKNMADAGNMEPVRKEFILDNRPSPHSTPLNKNMKPGDTFGFVLGKDSIGKKSSCSIHIHNSSRDSHGNVLVSIKANYDGFQLLRMKGEKKGKFGAYLKKEKFLRAMHTALHNPSQIKYAVRSTNPNSPESVHNYKKYVLEAQEGDPYFLRIVDLLHRNPKSNDDKVALGQTLEQMVIERNKLKYQTVPYINIDYSYLTELLTEAEVEKLQKIFGDYEGILEQRTAKQIIESRGKTGLDIFPYFNRYDRLTTHELWMTNANNVKNICMIGGGWLPISAIMYAQKTNAHITLIEKNPYRAQIAQQVIEALGLQDQITIINKKAQEFDYSNMDAVIFAAMADPKHEILHKVSETDFPKIILLRTPIDDARVLYKGFERDKFMKQLEENSAPLHHYFRTLSNSTLFYWPIDTGDSISIFTNTILFPFLFDGSQPWHVIGVSP